MRHRCLLLLGMVVLLSLVTLGRVQAESADPLRQIIFDGNVEYTLADFPGQSVIVLAFCRG